MKSTGRDRVIVQNPLLKHGFAQVPRPVLRARGLSHGAKTLYALLLDYAGQAGTCFPGQDSLAEELGLSVRHLSRTLSELRDYGLIDWQRRQRTSNLYIILDYTQQPDLEIVGARGREHLVRRARLDTGVQSTEEARLDAGVQSKAFDRPPAPLDRTPVTEERYSDNNTQSRPERHPAGPTLGDRAIWSATVEQLGEQLPTGQLEWLRSTRLLGRDDSTFVVGTPSTYARDWLNERLQPAARQVLAEIAGPGLDVRFVVTDRDAATSG